MSIETRIVPLERYAVTSGGVEGVRTVAENLTLKQAQDIKGAIDARAEAHGIDVLPVVELPVKE